MNFDTLVILYDYCSITEICVMFIICVRTCDVNCKYVLKKASLKAIFSIIHRRQHMPLFDFFGGHNYGFLDSILGRQNHFWIKYPF